MSAIRQGTLRGTLLFLHRWVGMTVGFALLLLALTGAVLVMRGYFEPVANSRLLTASTCVKPTPLDTLVQTAAKAHPGKPVSLEVSPSAGRSVAVQFGNKDYVYVDPCSRRVLGALNQYGGLAGTLDSLHRFRFLKDGRIVAGWFNAISLLVLVLAGVVIWWPRRGSPIKRAFTYERRLPGIAKTLSLHRFLGVYAGAFLLIMTATAVPLSFAWPKTLISVVTHSSTNPPAAPKLAVPVDREAISMERAWQSVRGEMPETEWAALRYPVTSSSPITVETLEKGAPHEEAKSYLFLDPATARPLRSVHYEDGVPAGRKVYLYILALHAGLVGGIIYQLALMLACLAVPIQTYSGIVPYFRRKLRPKGSSTLRLRLVQRTQETPDVTSFEFEATAGHPLPSFSAGSHIDLHLPSGLVRQYSLCNDSEENHRYLIAVLREEHSRGGSEYMHDNLAVGDTVEASQPRNYFPLVHEAKHSLLIAGGIGITPLLCMGERLAHAGASFKLHYCIRSAADIVFEERLRQDDFSQYVFFHISEQQSRLDVDALIAAQPPETEIYVCGPASLIDAVGQAASKAGLHEHQIHLERFAALQHDTTNDRAFAVKVASTGALIHVGAHESVTAALTREGIQVPTSCSEGICGTCITRVLQGEIDHRDALFTSEEKSRNDQFTPCCSRASGALLVLDL